MSDNVAYYDENEDLQSGEALSNFVRTNTEQDITGEKTFDNVNVNEFLKILTGYLQGSTPNGKFLKFSDDYNGLYFTCDLVLASDSNNNASTDKITISFPTISENYTLKLPTTAPSVGEYLAISASDTTQLIWNSPSGSGDVSASSTFDTDNVIIKSDGTAKGVQSTGISIDDSDNISGIVNLIQTGYQDLTEISEPSSPNANIGRLYTKDDGGTTKLYFKDSDGTETDLLASGGGSVAWGSITGTLSNQTDLQNALNLKADQTSLDTTNTNVSTNASDILTKQDILTEGAFVDGDKTKLDTIETNADVTDTTNVTSAGALMDSELTDLAGIKALDTSTLQVKPSEGAFVDGDKTKLDGIETNATADQTGSEIKTALFLESDTNNLTDALLSKLNGIEDNATADQSGSQIKALYEAEANTNAFTDAEQSKLNGIEDNATADQSGSEIKSLYEAEANTNAFTDAEQSKLSGIEASADVTDETNVVSSLNGATITSVTATTSDKAIFQDITDSDNLKQDTFGNILKLKPEALSYALSDESTDLTTGTKLTVRMPYAFTLTDVRASVTTAPTGANLVVDINEGGVSILSTKLSIDATEKTSTTATTPVVISNTSLADDAEITFDIDQIGSTIAGAGLKVTLIGTQS